MKSITIGMREYETDGPVRIIGVIRLSELYFRSESEPESLEEEEMQILARVEGMLEEGAEIIEFWADIPEQSSGPLAALEEEEHLIPMIKAVRHRFAVPLCVHTHRAGVAKKAIDAGCDMVYDPRGLMADQGEMARLIADTGVVVVIAHQKEHGDYRDLLSEIKEGLTKSIETAREAKIEEDHILLDCALGLSRTPDQDLRVLNHLEEFSDLSYPLVSGITGDTIVGGILDVAKDQRSEGVLILNAMAAMKGALFIRTETVGPCVLAVTMMEKLLEKA